MTFSPNHLYRHWRQRHDRRAGRVPHTGGGVSPNTALRGEMHGFTNVSETIAELYQGINKSSPMRSRDWA